MYVQLRIVVCDKHKNMLQIDNFVKFSRETFEKLKKIKQIMFKIMFGSRTKNRFATDH